MYTLYSLDVSYMKRDTANIDKYSLIMHYSSEINVNVYACTVDDFSVCLNTNLGTSPEKNGKILLDDINTLLQESNTIYFHIEAMRNVSISISALTALRVNYSGIEVSVSTTPVYLEVVTCNLDVHLLLEN